MSKARKRARRGKAFRVGALAVQKGLRGRGLAAEAMKRLQEELGELRASWRGGHSPETSQHTKAFAGKRVWAKPSRLRA